MSAANEGGAFVPKALWVARSFRGLTVSDLANEARVSRGVVSTMENGGTVYPAALSAIADALRFPIEFFFTSGSVPDPSVLHFRRTASVTGRAIDQAMARAALFARVVEGFAAFARFRGPRLPEAVPTSGDAIEAAAEEFRAAIALRPDVPIINAVRAVEAAGVFVGLFDAGTIRVDGFAWYAAVPIIMLNQESCWSRRRFSAFHEAGHLVMHRRSSPEEQELHSHRFAGAVLVPRAAFRREFPRPAKCEFNWAAMIAMKERWGISLGAMVHRAYDLGIINAIQYRTANIHISKYGWRTEEPGELEAEEPEVCVDFLRNLQQRAKLGSLCRAANLFEENVEAILGIRVEDLVQDTAVVPITPRSPTRPDVE